MATNARNRRLESAYKQHTAVDQCGVIVDVEVRQVNRTRAASRRYCRDDGFGHRDGDDGRRLCICKGVSGAEDRGIEALVPAKAEPRPGKVIPTRRFKFDALHDLARCPEEKSCGRKASCKRLIPTLPGTRQGLSRVSAAGTLL
ncbi:hypothetical protein AJ88_37665 [Mesorhizobium amorphae CCBAU 01583]|nr:hypothetical protein AJ88_37665 [Mesorhizobium amorphae CCBAU 01583]